MITVIIHSFVITGGEKKLNCKHQPRGRAAGESAIEEGVA